MVSPFNVEEIFPDVDAGPVRLPRRQTGSSPQGLAVTLIADYTVHARAWLPTAAIVALLGEFGVTAGAARTAVSRLARRGVLEGSRHGRHSSYRLTGPAAANLSRGGTSIASFAAAPDSWDGEWTVIAFTMPTQEETRRTALRAQLRWLGYAPLYDGIWVSPHPPAPADHAELVALTPGVTTAFRAKQLPFTSNATRDPIHAWDLPAIAERYEEFIRRWTPLTPRVHAGDITGADAVRARTEVMDTYRRFPALDPRLPTRLLPPDWPRARAREVFLAVYDGLAEPAQDHVRAAAARITGEPRPDIRAHTIAEMATGIGLAAPAVTGSSHGSPHPALG
ncbi:PaaX family transcriptional regulator [Saccharothrix sp. S26]|uniref:PaaX family transcriptional regulator n=1 Tax=Saccharothrix sp. S26 TaxID=2907215 RepID=UPI001F1D1479|nr:PaaX family transcriptional regulator C-terminal domain-containing protein [Saccharothrix sp. S26]MCE6998689.1 PaaX family transcriptional regulator [Saccharothrix sp. S26]